MSSGTFPVILKTGIVTQYTKKETSSYLIIIGLFRHFPYLVNSMKKSYTKEYIVI